MLLLKQNVILDKILNILKEKEKETSDFLNALAMERERPVRESGNAGCINRRI